MASPLPFDALNELVGQLSESPREVEENVNHYFGRRGPSGAGPDGQPGQHVSDALARAIVPNLLPPINSQPGWLFHATSPHLDPAHDALTDSSAMPQNFENKASIFVEDAESEDAAETAAARVLTHAVLQPDLLPLRALVVLAQAVCEEEPRGPDPAYPLVPSDLRKELQRALPAPTAILQAFFRIWEMEVDARATSPPVGTDKANWRTKQASHATTWFAQRRLLLELLFWVACDAAKNVRGAHSDDPWTYELREDFLHNIVYRLSGTGRDAYYTAAFRADPTDVNEDCFQCHDVERIVRVSVAIDWKGRVSCPIVDTQYDPDSVRRYGALAALPFPRAGAQRAVAAAKRANSAIARLCVIAALGLTSPMNSYARPSYRDFENCITGQGAPSSHSKICVFVNGNGDALSVQPLLLPYPWDNILREPLVEMVSSARNSPSYHTFMVLSAAALALGIQRAKAARELIDAGYEDYDPLLEDEADKYDDSRLPIFCGNEVSIRAALSLSPVNSGARQSSCLRTCARELVAILNALAASPSWLAQYGSRAGGAPARAWPRAPASQAKAQSVFELGGSRARMLARELARGDSSDDEDQEADDSSDDDDDNTELVDPLFKAAQEVCAHAVAAVLAAREFVRTLVLRDETKAELLAARVQPTALMPIALLARRESRRECELRAVLALIRATHTTRDQAVFFWGGGGGGGGADIVNPLLSALRAARVSFPATIGPLCATLRALAVSEAEYADEDCGRAFAAHSRDSTRYLLQYVRSFAVRSWALDGAWEPNARAPLIENNLSSTIPDDVLPLTFLSVDEVEIAREMCLRNGCDPDNADAGNFFRKMLCPVPFGERRPDGSSKPLPFPSLDPQVNYGPSQTQVRPRPLGLFSAPRELGSGVSISGGVQHSYSIMHCSRCQQILAPAESADPQVSPYISWFEPSALAVRWWRVMHPRLVQCASAYCGDQPHQWGTCDHSCTNQNCGHDCGHYCGHYYCMPCAEEIHSNEEPYCPACNNSGAQLPHTEVFLLEEKTSDAHVVPPPLALLLRRLLRSDSDAGVTRENLFDAHRYLAACVPTAESLFALDVVLNKLAPRARELFHVCGTFADALRAKRDGRARRAMLKRLTNNDEIMAVIFDAVGLSPQYVNGQLGVSLRESLLLERLAEAAGRALDWLLPLAALASDMGRIGAADDDMVDDNGNASRFDDVDDEDAVDDSDDVDFAAGNGKPVKSPTGWCTRDPPPLFDQLRHDIFNQWPPLEECWPISRVDRPTKNDPFSSSDPSRPLTHELRYSALRSVRAFVLAAGAASDLFSLLCCDFTGVAAAAALAQPADGLSVADVAPGQAPLGYGTVAGVFGSRAAAPRVVVSFEHALAVARSGDAAPALALARAVRAVIAEARARISAPAAPLLAALRHRQHDNIPLPPQNMGFPQPLQYLPDAFTTDSVIDALIATAIARAGAGGSLFSGVDKAAFRARVASATIAAPFPSAVAGASSAWLYERSVHERIRRKSLGDDAREELFAQLWKTSPQNKLEDEFIKRNCACRAPLQGDKFSATFCRYHVSVWANRMRIATAPGAKTLEPEAALPVSKKNEEDRLNAAAELRRFVAAALGNDVDDVSLIAAGRNAARASAPVAAAAYAIKLPSFDVESLQSGASPRTLAAQFCLLSRATKILALLAEVDDFASQNREANSADISSAFAAGARGALAVAAAPGLLSASDVKSPLVPRPTLLPLVLPRSPIRVALPLLDLENALNDAFGADSHEYRWAWHSAVRGARLLPRLLSAAGRDRLPTPSLLNDCDDSLNDFVRGGTIGLSPVSALLALANTLRAGPSPAYAFAAMLRRAGRDAALGARRARKDNAKKRASGKAYAARDVRARVFSGPDDPDGFDTPLRDVVDEDAGGASGSGSEGEDDFRDRKFSGKAVDAYHARSVRDNPNGKCLAGYDWLPEAENIYRCAAGFHRVQVEAATEGPALNSSRGVHWILLIDQGASVKDHRRDIFDVYRSILETRCESRFPHATGGNGCNDLISVINVQTPLEKRDWPRYPDLVRTILNRKALCEASRKAVPTDLDPFWQAASLADGLRIVETISQPRIRGRPDPQVVLLLFTGAADEAPANVSATNKWRTLGNVRGAARDFVARCNQLQRDDPTIPPPVAHILNFGVDNATANAAGYDGAAALEVVERLSREKTVEYRRSAPLQNRSSLPDYILGNLESLVADNGLGSHDPTLDHDPRKKVDVQAGAGAAVAAVVAAELSANAACVVHKWPVHFGALSISDVIAHVFASTSDWKSPDPFGQPAQEDEFEVAPNTRPRALVIDRLFEVPEHVVDDARRSRMSVRLVARTPNLDSDNDASDASDSSASDTEDAVVAVPYTVAQFEGLCAHEIELFDATASPPRRVRCSLTAGLRALLFGGPGDLVAALEDAIDLAGKPDERPPISPRVPRAPGQSTSRECCKTSPGGFHGACFEPLRNEIPGAAFLGLLYKAEDNFRQTFTQLHWASYFKPAVFPAKMGEADDAKCLLEDYARQAELFDSKMEASFSVVVAAATEPAHSEFVKLLLAPSCAPSCTNSRHRLQLNSKGTPQTPTCPSAGEWCQFSPDAVRAALHAIKEPDCDASVGGARALAALLRLRSRARDSSILTVLARIDDVMTTAPAKQENWWRAALTAMCDYRPAGLGRLLLHPLRAAWFIPSPGQTDDAFLRSVHSDPRIQRRVLEAAQNFPTAEYVDDFFNIGFVWSRPSPHYRDIDHARIANRDIERTRLLRSRAAFVDLVAAALENSRGPAGEYPVLASIGEISITLIDELQSKSGAWRDERRKLAVSPSLDVAVGAEDDSESSFIMAEKGDTLYVEEMRRLLAEAELADVDCRIADAHVASFPPGVVFFAEDRARAEAARDVCIATQRSSKQKIRGKIRALLADCSDALGTRRADAERKERLTLIAAGIDPAARGSCSCSGSSVHPDCASRLADVLGLGSAWRAERSRDRALSELVYGTYLRGESYSLPPSLAVLLPQPARERLSYDDFIVDLDRHHRMAYDDFRERFGSLYKEEISATLATLTHAYRPADYSREGVNDDLPRREYFSRTRAAFDALGSVAEACRIRALEAASARGAHAVSRLFAAVRTARNARWHKFSEEAAKAKPNHSVLQEEFSEQNKGDDSWPTQNTNVVFLCATRAAALAGGPKGAVIWARAAADAAAYDGAGGGPPPPHKRAFALASIVHTLNSLEKESASASWSSSERVAVGAALCAAARALVPRAPSPARWTGVLYPDGSFPTPRNSTAYPKSWPFDVSLRKQREA
jgi:hypothetical protein